MSILDKVKPKKATSAKKASVAVSDTKVQTTQKAKATVGLDHDVLQRPLLSEKGTWQESMRQYTFIVRKNATKIDVKRAIVALYNVMPTRVNIINVEGKEKMFGRYSGRRSDIKKAIVTLPKDKKIDIHEGV